MKNNFKKLSTLALTAVFALTSLAPSTAAFADVRQEADKKEEKAVAADIANHWAGSTLAEFNQKGYLKGDSAGLMHPNKQMSRAEYAAVINRMMKFTKESPEISQFDDVKAGDWFYSDMAKALKAGYMKGTGAGTMSPQATLTREQAFVMLYRLSYPKGAEGQKQADLSSFADGHEVSSWAKEAVSVLVGSGAIKGELGRLNPSKNISRAESVTILSRSEGRLTASAAKPEDKKEEKDIEEFTGTGAGYGGTMTLKVIFEKGKIADIKIVSERETSSYLERAKVIIPQIIAKQGVEGVDNISGATKTCNAIKDAVKDCVSQQKGQGSVGTVGSTGKRKSGGKNVDTPKGINFAIKDRKIPENKYFGAARGHRDYINVEVCVSDEGKVTEIKLGKHSEDAGYFDSNKAKELADKIIKKQSTIGIETISGATNSSNGFIGAVESAVIGEIARAEDFKLDNGSIKIAGQSSGVERYLRAVQKVTVRTQENVSGFKTFKVYTPLMGNLKSAALPGNVPAVGGAVEKVYGGKNAKLLFNPETGTVNANAKVDGEFVFAPNIKYDIEIEATAYDNVELRNYTLPKTATKYKVESELKSYWGEAYGESVKWGQKNLVKITVKDGRLENLEFENFVDGYIRRPYADKLLNYVKNTDISNIKAQILNKSGEVYESVRNMDDASALGAIEAIEEAQRAAMKGEPQVYKAFYIIKKGKERYRYGETIDLNELVVKPYMVNDNVKDTNGSIKATDFNDTNGIEAYITDGKNNRYDIKSAIEYKDEYGLEKDFQIHFIHKPSGKEIVQSIKFTRDKRLGADENAIKTKSDQLFQEQKVKMNKALADGKFSGRGTGFATTRGIKADITIASRNITKVEVPHRDDVRPNPDYADDGGDYQTIALKIIPFLKGEQNTNGLTVADYVALLRVHHNYTNQILKGVAPEEKVAIAEKLIGREFAESCRVDEKSATGRVSVASGAVKEYMVAQYPSYAAMFDAIAGATMSADGIADAVGDAMEISIHDNTSTSNVGSIELEIPKYNRFIVNGKTNLSLEGLKVKLKSKQNEDLETVELADFESKGISMYEKESHKPVTHGMSLEGFRTSDVIVKHGNSRRTAEFRIEIRPNYSENWVVGMEYQLENEEGWREVPNPVMATETTAEPYMNNNIAFKQIVQLEGRETIEAHKDRKIKIRIKTKDGKYVFTLPQSEDAIKNDFEIRFFVGEAYQTASKENCNLNFLYSITFRFEEEEEEEGVSEID